METRMQVRIPRPGDVFAVPLDDRRYAVARVLRVSETDEGPTALVAITPWLGTHVPDLAEPQLREILRRHRGRFGGQPALCWYSGTPPREFVYLGVLTPTSDELGIDPQGAYCGLWDISMGREVLLERGEPPPQRRTAPSKPSGDQVPGNMPDEEFWDTISLLDWTAESLDEIVEPAVERLSHLPPIRIGGFQRQLAERLFALDRVEFAREIGQFSYGSPEGFSPDHFLDVRCAVVAKGKEFYEGVLVDPRTMPKNLEFEPLLSVAEKAYRRRTGRTPVFLGGNGYQTFSNKEGWPHESL